MSRPKGRRWDADEDHAYIVEMIRRTRTEQGLPVEASATQIAAASAILASVPARIRSGDRDVAA